MKTVDSIDVPKLFKKSCRENFIGVPSEMLLEPHLNVYQFRVYLCLYGHIGGHGESNKAMLSYSTIAEQTGISLPKVKSVVKELAELRLVSIEKKKPDFGGNAMNSYTLYYPSARP
ncbi:MULTISPECIES: helix-turn-helix domain-containing protein [unclassified Paenibacillus]|uniref:helix-turn-helix domain-containing protein n=1 Tax=unclassified Paenibacillus TaxID=185978 RepID=UPI0030FCA953